MFLISVSAKSLKLNYFQYKNISITFPISGLILHQLSTVIQCLDTEVIGYSYKSHTLLREALSLLLKCST